MGKKGLAMIKKRVIALLLALTALTFAGCGSEPAPAPDVSEPESSAPVFSAPTSSEEEQPAPVNPLTGAEDYPEDMLYQRPVAVMFNNATPALPQKGISSADIVYEMQVEYSITRLMGVFSDLSAIPDVGSVRSARPDFIELMLPMNAIYVHFGQSTQAKSAIEQYGISSINGIKLVQKAFYLDEQRAANRSSEHCWFSNKDLILAGALAEKIELTSSDPFQPVFHFAKAGEEAMPASAASALSISVPVSPIVKAGFIYDEKSRTYAKSQNGNPHLDSLTGEAAKVTNVLVMYTSCDLMADGVHRDIGLESGTGYYLSHGKVQEVQFKKEGVSEPMQVLNSDGEPVKINVGQTWVCFAPTDAKEKTIIDAGGTGE